MCLMVGKGNSKENTPRNQGTVFLYKKLFIVFPLAFNSLEQSNEFPAPNSSMLFLW